MIRWHWVSGLAKAGGAIAVGSTLLAAAAQPAAGDATPTPGTATKVGTAIDRAWSAVSDELGDAIVKTKIRIAMLEHLKSDGLRIQIDVKAGIVELSGQVQKRANQRLAQQVAASVDGVKEVHDRVGLAPATGPAPSATATFVGKAERGFDDALLQAKVKARLLEELGKPAFKIDVDATDGVVSLSGTVPDDARRALAAKLARQTSGVRELHDLLRVQPQ